MQLFPRTGPRPTTSQAELALYAALQRSKLPYSAFHSLRLRTRAGWEGEGDFVLVDPARGLLVLEVKGGRLELRDGHWWQNGKRLDTSPRTQAQQYVRRLHDEVKAATGEVVPYGIGCVFPDTEFSEAPQVGDLRGLVLGRRDLPYLTERLPALLDAALPGHLAAPRSRTWVDAVTKLWGVTWVPSVSLTERVEDAAARSVALDAQQYGVLELAGQCQRALVEGAAGTGKTLVATELCRRRAREGQRALYLCFTDALARAVQRQFDGEPLEGGAARPRATTIRQLAVELLQRSGQTIPQRDRAFWENVAFTAACDALPEERPDLVVVDEGQDFEAGDWQLVEQLAGPRGLWVFRDPRQAFWSDRPLLPSIEATLPTRLTLPRSYRCPDALAAFANAFLEPGPPRLVPEEAVVRLVRCAADDVVERVRHEVDLLRKQGARPSDIVVVSLAGQTRSALFKVAALGSHRVVHGDAPDAAQHVVVETFLRFKGLERPFVIVAELSGAYVTHFATRMHIALTRATVQATVVADSGRIESDPRLAALAARPRA